MKDKGIIVSLIEIIAFIIMFIEISYSFCIGYVELTTGNISIVFSIVNYMILIIMTEKYYIKL